MSTIQLSKGAALKEQAAIKIKKPETKTTPVSRSRPMHSSTLDEHGNAVIIRLDWNGTKNFYLTVNGITKTFLYKTLEWYLISGTPSETAAHVYYNFDSHV